MNKKNALNFPNQILRSENCVEITFSELITTIEESFGLFEPGLKKFRINYTISRIKSEFEFKISDKIDSILLSIITRFLCNTYSDLNIKVKQKLIWNTSNFQPEILRIRFILTSADNRRISRSKKNHIFNLMNLDEVKIEFTNKKNTFECIDVLLPIKALANEKFSSLITSQNQVSKEKESSPNNEFIVQLKRYINEYSINENPEFNDLCKHFAMSRSTFYRKIKVITGLSPSKFIRSHYLDLAAERLINSDDPITNIAYDYGFTNSSYFSKSFKEQFQESPLNYRKKSKGFL